MSARSCGGRGSRRTWPSRPIPRRPGGRKKRAKTDRADARLQRELLAQGRLPECWIPPSHVLECRALLETYHDLRAEHTAWVQRAHAVLFHQGAPAFHDLSRADAPAELAELARGHLPAAGQVQVGVCLRMLAALGAELDATRRRLLAAARQMRGAKVLAESIYGVGPVTALALTCWLAGAGRFTSARKAVRFTGLDITVYSSDSKRSPGHLSRQGPPVLRWALYEAGKTHARSVAPDHGYYAAVKDRKDGKRAALSEARKIVRRACHILAELGDDALATVTRKGEHRRRMETGTGAIIKPMRHQTRPAPASPRSGRLRPATRG
jgi:transposase